jgi:hypothetical protein
MRYDARVTVTITRTYTTVVETDDLLFRDRAEAEAWIRHHALGLKQAQLDLLVDADEADYEGEETTVVGVADAEEVEDDEAALAAREARVARAEDEAFAEWAARDPEGAAREAERRLDEEED